MGIYLNTTELDKIYLGTAEVDKAYLGTAEIFSSSLKLTELSDNIPASLNAAAYTNQYTLTVTGDPGARVNIVGTNGATSTNNQQVGSDGTVDIHASIEENTGAARTPTWTMEAANDDTTVTDTTPTVTTSQQAGYTFSTSGGYSQSIQVSGSAGTFTAQSFSASVTINNMTGGNLTATVVGQNIDEEWDNNLNYLTIGSIRKTGYSFNIGNGGQQVNISGGRVRYQRPGSATSWTSRVGLQVSGNGLTKTFWAISYSCTYG